MTSAKLRVNEGIKEGAIWKYLITESADGVCVEAFFLCVDMCNMLRDFTLAAPATFPANRHLSGSADRRFEVRLLRPFRTPLLPNCTMDGQFLKPRGSSTDNSLKGQWWWLKECY